MKNYNLIRGFTEIKNKEEYYQGISVVGENIINDTLMVSTDLERVKDAISGLSTCLSDRGNYYLVKEYFIVEIEFDEDEKEIAWNIIEFSSL